MPINRDRMLDQFLSLLRINSPPLKEGQIAAYLRNELRKLGFEVLVDGAGEATGGEVGNLIARKQGRRDAPWLMLSAHMDTVQPTEGLEPVVEGGVVRSSGSTILGADDKASLAIILEAVRALDEDEAPRGPLEVVFSIAEEIGLRGARAMDLIPT